MKLIDNYRKLGAKQFIAKWKEGVKGITPLQQLEAQLPSFFLIFIGIVIGIIVNIKTQTWWLLIILIGALGINFMSFIAVYQKYLVLQGIQKELNSQEDNYKEVQHAS